MRTLRVKLHSSVDIITNSSTVIFTYVNSVDAVKEFIDEILGGLPAVSLKADDLYEFKVVLSSNALEVMADKILDDEDVENPHFLALKEIGDDPQYKDKWRERYEAQNNYLRDRVDVDSAPEHWSGYPAETELLIIPKGGDGPNHLGKLLENVFTHEATHDG